MVEEPCSKLQGNFERKDFNFYTCDSKVKKKGEHDERYKIVSIQPVSATRLL